MDSDKTAINADEESEDLATTLKNREEYKKPHNLHWIDDNPGDYVKNLIDERKEYLRGNLNKELDIKVRWCELLQTWEIIPEIKTIEVDN